MTYIKNKWVDWQRQFEPEPEDSKEEGEDEESEGEVGKEKDEEGDGESEGEGEDKEESEEESEEGSSIAHLGPELEEFPSGLTAIPIKVELPDGGELEYIAVAGFSGVSQDASESWDCVPSWDGQSTARRVGGTPRRRTTIRTCVTTTK